MKSTDIKFIEIEIKQLSETFEGDAELIGNEVGTRLDKYKKLQQNLKLIDSILNKLEKNINTALNRLSAPLQDWGILEDLSLSPSQLLTVALEKHSEPAKQYNPSELTTLLNEVDSLNSEIRSLNLRIDEIDEKLAQVELKVINEASIIGATLTKTNLSDDIQGRKFDTAILDEASMALIPALWTAALLSIINLIVGDFNQLPQIVLSNKEVTKKWLGRDIFEVSGMKDLWNKKSYPSYFIPLKEQRRMVPEIRKVANQFYDGLLEDADKPPNGQKDFLKWYRTNWSYDNPVILVDTASLNAWVTSVVKGGNTSRLNFLSATVSVDLAEQLLDPERPKRSEGAPKRILIVAPYRAHAKLVRVLLSDLTHIQDEVIAGTVHSFQGSEADVVIFDLMVDEPHFRVNLFMPQLDEQLKCLLNVGLTRAKFRLFILGDFAYCQSLGKKAFLGRSLLPYLLKKFPCISPIDIVPDGLAARVAKSQMTILGGEIEPDSDRVVVMQTDFYRLLSSDLSRAQNRIIIYSPFMTQDRLAFLMPQIQAATKRGVEVFVITKAHQDRSRMELIKIRKIETQLTKTSIHIIHKMRMHEKLAFIDNDITWSGSLNPLSFSNTQEVMERRKSKTVLSDYFQTLRLQELLSIQGMPESKCPICGAEMLAAEEANQPYYWRCTENSRHRMKVFKSHLRLPKMVALIPKREFRMICSIFEIDSVEEYFSGSKESNKNVNGQKKLFDL
jgi:hypothetical protein